MRTVLALRGHYPDPLAWGGGRIVFLTDRGLESVGPRGGKAEPIVLPGVCQQDCTDGFILSPNRRIVAVQTGSGSVHVPLVGIRLVKLRGGKRPVVVPTPLTADGATDVILAFSPNGTQLVFRRWSVGLMAIPVRGGEAVPLAQSGIPGASLVPSDVLDVQWSPDGRWVAFVENQSLEVVQTTGASPPRVLAAPFGTDADGFVGHFSWSPTSKLIAYECCFNQADQQFVTVRPDGTHRTDLLGARRLTYASEADFDLPAERAPLWSPDGSRLVFPASRVGHRTIHVWTIRPNGHDLVRLG